MHKMVEIPISEQISELRSLSKFAKALIYFHKEYYHDYSR